MFNVIVENFAKVSVNYESTSDFAQKVTFQSSRSDVPELFKTEIIMNGEYLNEKNFEEVTFTPKAKLPTLGLKLPKTAESWNRANKFFKSTLISTNKSLT